MQSNNKEYSRHRKCGLLDLTLDVDAFEGCLLLQLEQLTSFAGEDTKLVFLLFENVFATIIDNELGGVAIRLKAEFFGNKSQLDIWLESM